ncbi:unnamed protein product [Rotaria sp. Silwood2]|nr:unnamed protein product [Rotaria sp. Silwood2]
MPSSIFSFLQLQVNCYVIPTIIILGDIGNIFIVILFNRRRKNSCSTYILWASIMNSVAITFNVIYTLYSVNYGDPTLRSLIFCKFRPYIPQVFSQTARYFFILACIDRFVLTINHSYFRVISRPFVVRCLMGIVFIFWLIFLIHIIIGTTIKNGQCNQFGVYSFMYFLYLLIFVCLAPLILKTIFGFLAYYNMNSLHRRVQPINNVAIHRQDRELFKLVLAEVIVYLITTLPYPAIIIEMAATNYMNITKSIERIEMEYFFLTSSFALIYLNCSTPFYTYFVVYKKFRKDFKTLLLHFSCQYIWQIDTTES